MKLPAQITHKAPGRIRFKVPSKRRDESFFSALKIDYSGFEGVKHVRANELTGSVLLLTDITRQDKLIERIRKHPLLDFGSENHLARESGAALTATEPFSAAQKAAGSLSSFDTTLREFSNGYLDLRSVFFIALVAFAARQLMQGAVFGNAISLVWYALQLIRPRDANN